LGGGGIRGLGENVPPLVRKGRKSLSLLRRGKKGRGIVETISFSLPTIQEGQGRSCLKGKEGPYLHVLFREEGEKGRGSSKGRST